MENPKVICKTDAEILLDFKPLKDSGFAFEYAKKENGIFQRYVNCNGTAKVAEDKIADKLRELVDLRPRKISERLELRNTRERC